MISTSYVCYFRFIRAFSFSKLVQAYVSSIQYFIPGGLLAAHSAIVIYILYFLKCILFLNIEAAFMSGDVTSPMLTKLAFI